MNGAMPPFPNTPSWRGAQLEKKYQGQFFLLPRMLNKKEFCDLYRSPCTVRMLKSRRLWWAWHVA